MSDYIKIDADQFEAAVEFEGWDFGFDKATSSGKLLHAVCVDAAAVVADEVQRSISDRGFCTLDATPEIVVWPIGADELFFKVDIAAAIRDAIEDDHGGAREYRECAATLRQLADECERLAERTNAE